MSSSLQIVSLVALAALALGSSASAQTRARPRSSSSSMAAGAGASPLGRGPVRAEPEQHASSTRPPRDIFEALENRSGRPSTYDRAADWASRPTRPNADQVAERLRRTGQNRQLGQLQVDGSAVKGDFAEPGHALALVRVAASLASRGHYSRVNDATGSDKVVDVYMGRVRVGRAEGEPTDTIRLTIRNGVVIDARPHRETFDEIAQRVLFGGG